MPRSISYPVIFGVGKGLEMIKGFINPLYLDRIINELGGCENIAEYREGVLVDSMLFYIGDSVVALMEHPTGCDRSVYRVEMAPEGTPEASKIESYFTMSYTLD